MVKPIGQHADGSQCWTIDCSRRLKIEQLQLIADFEPKKFCAACQQTLPLACFGKNKAKPDGLQARCRQCRIASNRAFYEATREKHKDLRKAAGVKVIARNKAYLQAYKESHPCIDCGMAILDTLDFDHREGVSKLFDVSTLTKAPIKTIQVEIAKCDVRCANCHRIRTYGNDTWRTGHHPDVSAYKRISRNNELIRQKKQTLLLARFANGCVDCKVTDPRVLEMDHVRGQKVANISDMIRKGSSMAKFVEELAKCDVRCANCHRIVTRSREQEQKVLSL